LEALLALLALETIALLPSQFVSFALLAMGGTHKLLFDFSSMRTCSSSLSCDNGKLVLCLWRLWISLYLLCFGALTLYLRLGQPLVEFSLFRLLSAVRGHSLSPVALCLSLVYIEDAVTVLARWGIIICLPPFLPGKDFLCLATFSVWSFAELHFVFLVKFLQLNSSWPLLQRFD
jgi:hypothetical protein